MVFEHLQMALPVYWALDTVTKAPPRMLVLTLSSAVLVSILVPVYVVTTMGYPRPFWSHHSMDLEGSAREVALRMVRRAHDVRECLDSHPHDPVTSALVSAYPSLPRFAAARGPGDDAPGGDTTETEATEDVLDSILGVSKSSEMLEAARKLADCPDVHTVVTPLASRLEDTEVCPEQVQRAVCAVADARLIAATVVAPLRDMQSDRQRKMNLPETVKFHVEPEARAYMQRVRQAVDVPKQRYAKSRLAAKQLVDLLDSAADMVMFGERREGFGAIFKLAGALIKIVPPLVKVAFAILQVIVSSIDDIMLLLVQLARGINFFASELKRGLATGQGVIPGLIALVRVAVGMCMKVGVALGRIILVEVAAAVMTYVWPYVKVVYMTKMFVLVAVAKLLVAIADYFTDGLLRCLGRADHDPQAWWKHVAHEQGNTFWRNLVVFRPCMYGYTVSLGGFFCQRQRSGLPARSPAALIARKYILGSYRDYGRKIPSRDAATLEQYTRLCNREYKRFQDKNVFVKDLVTTLAMCRSAVLGRDNTVEELCNYAVGAQRKTSGVDKPTAFLGIAIILTAIAISVAGIGARYIVRNPYVRELRT